MNEDMPTMRKDLPQARSAIATGIRGTKNMLKTVCGTREKTCACKSKGSLGEESQDIGDIIQTCADITRNKGFDVTQHATQIALIATEVVEALECLRVPTEEKTRGEMMVERTVKGLSATCHAFEVYRKNAPIHCDTSTIGDQHELLEELADICIRVFSYVGGNGWKDEFTQALTDKIQKNAGRPHKHGKGF